MFQLILWGFVIATVILYGMIERWPRNKMVLVITMLITGILFGAFIWFLVTHGNRIA